MAKSPMNVSRAARSPSSPGASPTFGTCASAALAAGLNSVGQSGSQGSGSSSPISTARHAANGLRAHHRCSVDGCPCRMLFSLAECLLTSAMGKSTSMRRLHVRGMVTLLKPYLPGCLWRTQTRSLSGRREPACVAIGRQGRPVPPARRSGPSRSYISAWDAQPVSNGRAPPD